MGAAWGYALAAWEVLESGIPARCADGQYNSGYTSCVNANAGQYVADPSWSSAASCPSGTYTS